MNKLPLIITTVFTLLLFSVSPTLAFTLDSIGSSSLTSQNISEWWYTSQNPTLSGTAAAGSTVAITIDSQNFSSTTDTSGNWIYTPTTLTTGDHTVSITGDGQTTSFTLHIGQSAPTSTSTSSSQTLPVSGSTTQTLTLLGLGAAILFLGLKLKPASQF